MTGAIWSGRIAGVPVGVHWSVTGALGVLVGPFGFARWPRVFPGYPEPVLVGASVVTAVLFVVSVLVHHLAHALVARRHGFAVRHVTLWLLGGVARLRGQARRPGGALRTAVAGPLASLATGALLGLVAWLAAAAEARLLADALTHLVALNVALALVDLLPAAPLDGGRILRAALRVGRMGPDRATVWSTRAEAVFGAVLIGYATIRLVIGPAGGAVLWLLAGLILVVVAVWERRRALPTRGMAPE
ncbi:site-2 protease family protein [Amycolatopsis thermoflava]|uniref:site-2 protease family protein n=1 Tax=Amycolatopsis thermoflava TaxID=84480 RepID=UPI003EC0AB44